MLALRVVPAYGELKNLIAHFFVKRFCLGLDHPLGTAQERMGITGLVTVVDKAVQHGFKLIRQLFFRQISIQEAADGTIRLMRELAVGVTTGRVIGKRSVCKKAAIKCPILCRSEEIR